MILAEVRNAYHNEGKQTNQGKHAMTLKYLEPSEPIFVSDAAVRHHLKYIGRTGGFKNDDGTARVPTPQEVVDQGWEPSSYLDQFNF